jgi:cob(I)alamin adenosyltransferase
MGFRLSKIYTRTGDDGTTGISGNRRQPKNSPRITAIGSVDELNSFIGLLLCEDLPDQMRATLVDTQHRLFDLGGELSMPGHATLQMSATVALETELDALNEGLDPLDNFILPGGTRPASLCHVTRSVARRAERDLVTLQQREPVSPVGIAYLNRLSDLLFVMARALNKQAGRPDVLWQQEKTGAE